MNVNRFILEKSYKLVSLISNNIYVFIAGLIILIPFITFQVILVSLVLVGFLFQNLYMKRNSSTVYPYVTLDSLLILINTLLIIFIKITLNMNNLEFCLLFPLSYTLFRIKHKIKNRKANYLDNPKITFTLMLSTLILAWLSGGVVDYLTGYVSSSDLFQQFGFFTPNSPVNLIMDFLSLFATITATPWFMIVMGIWLGILGFFKVLETNTIENRIRLLLMMFAYAFYSIWLPSFSPISNNVPYIPYMWFNGLGTYGPVEPSYLLDGILGTFIVTAILSFLFGSRQICSVTCTAPFMLQGTFTDSLKKYNRSSKMGRKTLTSKIGKWYRYVMILTWSSLITFALISYLDYEKVINITILGNDPTMFYASLYFNVIWYLQFILIPFVGNYSCVNSGICAWGSFNQFFGYLGFFKLKVKDPSACLKCKTADCANACPVGITDMRAFFIKKGEFKSFKCIGVGDCVEACPYNNIVFYDVRQWLKNKIKI